MRLKMVYILICFRIELRKNVIVCVEFGCKDFVYLVFMYGLQIIDNYIFLLVYVFIKNY